LKVKRLNVEGFLALKVERMECRNFIPNYLQPANLQPATRLLSSDLRHGASVGTRSARVSLLEVNLWFYHEQMPDLRPEVNGIDSAAKGSF
jgi:hypothetical protein